jgi:hypothetical protein
VLESEGRGGSPVEELQALLQERPDDEVAKMHLDRFPWIAEDVNRDRVSSVLSG